MLSNFTLNFWKSLFIRPTKYPIDPESPTINLPVTLANNDLTISTTFALDTGASYTVVLPALAKKLRLKPKGQAINVATGAGLVDLPITTIPQIAVLGKTQTNCPALIADIPEESGIEGLLGLSFFKHYKLIIDFKSRNLSLTN